MDMFRTFFEKSEVDTSVYFQDKKIWACGEKYREFQGKYPVIFITFKNVKFETWQENFGNIKTIIAAEFRRHSELFESEKCDSYEKA